MVWKSNKKAGLTISGILASAVWAAPAISQDQTQTLSVESASDLNPNIVGRDAPVPSAALQIEPDEVPLFTKSILAPMYVETIDGTGTISRENLPGKEDDRPRYISKTKSVGSSVVAAEVAPSTAKIRSNWMMAHFIDVGQGDATLLEFPCAAILVDTGGQSDRKYDSNESLKEYLTVFFDRRTDLNRKIAALFLTHPHIDHTRGTKIFTEDGADISIGTVVANSRTTGSGSSQQNRMVSFANSNGIDVDLIDNDEVIRLDGLTNSTIDPVSCSGVDPEIRVLWGTGDSDDHWSKDANNNSVVVRVDFGKSSFLFTGDLEETGQPNFLRSYRDNPEILDVDVYQVGHHGSRNGTTDALVAAMKPKVAVIGAGNPADEEPQWSAYVYGHPNLRAINALRHPTHGVTMRRKQIGVPVGIKGRNPRRKTPPIWRVENLEHAIFSTGWDGDVVVAASSEGELVVKTD